MLASQRRDLILAELERTGGVRVSELTTRFGVSDMTVRRDLEHLEGHGWLRKVHGGAVAATSSAEEPGFEAKRLLQQSVKRAIAERAAALVEPHSAVGISAGTTTWMLASHLKSSPGPLSVVTNSTTVADVMFSGGASGGVTVILTGGVRTPSAALVGPVADRTINSLHVDRLFLGVHGMDSAAGFTTPESRRGTDQPVLHRARPTGGRAGRLDEMGNRGTGRHRTAVRGRRVDHRRRTARRRPPRAGGGGRRADRGAGRSRPGARRTRTPLRWAS